MKQRLAKASLIIIEIVAIFLAIGAAGAVFLYWHVQQAPVSIAFAKPTLSYFLLSKIPEGYAVDIDKIFLIKDKSTNLYTVRIENITIVDQNHFESARADNFLISFHPGDILRGKSGPREIIVEAARFNIVRNKSQNLKIPSIKFDDRKNAFSFLKSVFRSNVLDSAFEKAVMQDATIVFRDIASGKLWQSNNAYVEIVSVKNGVAATVSGDIDLNTENASILAEVNYDSDLDIVKAEITGSSFPVGDILAVFYGSDSSILDAPVSGKAAISLTPSGDVISSAFNATIEGGNLIISSKLVPVKRIHWETNFDPNKNKFLIENFDYHIDGNEGNFSGDVSVLFGADIRQPKSVRFNLVGKELILNLENRLPKPLPIAVTMFSGQYELSDRRLDFDEFSISMLNIKALGSFSITFPRSLDTGDKPSKGVYAKLNVEGDLDPSRLLKVWPIDVAMGARDWVEDRLESAVISNIQAEVALPEGAIDETNRIPDEAINARFDIDDAKVFFVKQMIPLTDGGGSGILRGNSFYLDAHEGKIGAVSITEGEVEFPTFIPKWQPTYIRFVAKGKSEDILGILNQKPLSLLSKINLDPEQFIGEAHARIEIMRPNKRDVATEEYSFRGKATFNNMQITGIIGDADIANASGKVELEPRFVKISADAALSQSPIKIIWKQNFFEQDGPSSFSISGVADSSTGDVFGVSTRQYIRGPVAYSALAIGEIGDFKSFTAEADFTNSFLSADALGWKKEIREAVIGELQILFTPDGAKVEKAKIKGEGVSIEGEIQFRDDKIMSARFPLFQLQNAANLSVSAQRKPSGEMSITALGEYLSIEPLMEEIVSAGINNKTARSEFSWGDGLKVTARIDKLRMRENIVYENTSLDLWRDAESLQELTFSAFSSHGAPIQAAMAHTGEDTGPRQSIEANTSDLGNLLRAVFGYNSIEGGEGVMKIHLADETKSGLSGKIEAIGLRIVDAPLVARLFSAGSFVGLADLVNGEGIDLSYANGNFAYVDDVLTISDFHATGPSVGMTADGVVSVNEGGEIALSGALAPLYQLNSALGSAPIIGDILVGKPGEGVLALSYNVTGARSSPVVYVNPLSALTPGIFRNLFDYQSPANDNGKFSVEENTKSETTQQD